nr:DUF1799 domain-containing protein [Massilia sp. CFBP 13721]
MAASGLTREDYADECFEVWPENWPSFRLLCDIQTQWRGAGMGIVGLDYSVMYHKMDRMKLTPAEYDDIESDMRVMEASAMAAMREED